MLLIKNRINSTVVKSVQPNQKDRKEYLQSYGIVLKL